MKSRIILIFILLLSATWFIILQSCEYDRPDEIFKPATGAATPIITNVNPASASDGITRLVISGENFIPESDANFVYFGTTEGEVLSAQENQLIVSRPVQISGDFMIKVTTRDAFNPVEFGPFSLEPGIVQLGEEDKYNSIVVDQDENLYADKDEIIYKITPDGSITEFSATGFNTSCMRFGNDGTLYLQKRDNRSFYKVIPGGGIPEQLGRIKKAVSYFDFDQDGFIYSGSIDEGLYITNPDVSSSAEFEGYKDIYSITAVRVYDGFVYLAADTITDVDEERYSVIFKHQLNGSGTLGERITFLNWSDIGIYSQSKLYDFTFSDDRKIIAVTDSDNPLVVINPEGSIQPLFNGNLTGPATKIFWGSGNYIYYLLTATETVDSGIFRVIMGQNGAPYHGRD